MVIVINEDDIASIFNTVNWTFEEITVFKDYCLIENIRDISELSYIILSMIHDTYTGSPSEFILGVESNTTFHFNTSHLTTLSQSFFDETVYMIEEVVCLNMEANLKRGVINEFEGSNSEFSSNDIEEYYDRCMELYFKLMTVFLCNSVEEGGGYLVSHVKGGLVCSS